MTVLLARTKIATTIALSGFLCFFSSPSALAQATATQASPQPTATENSGQQGPAGTVQQSPSVTNEPQSDSPAAEQPAQPSPASAPDKDATQSSATPKTAKTRPRAQMKNQSSKSPRQAALAASSASAPEVPGVNDFAPGKVVISNGGAKEIRLQLTPTTTPEEAALQRRQTRNLLFISSENLKRIAGHNLDANQQDMLGQVHNYMAQARAADKAGELQRAQLLASKARQLSDDLAGVRTILKLWPW